MGNLHGGGIRVVREGSEKEFREDSTFGIYGDDGSQIAIEIARITRDSVIFSEKFADILGIAIGTESLDRDRKRQRPFNFYDRISVKSAAKPHDEDLLLKLGTEMAASADDWRINAVDIPAVYTYIGQFIAHDISLMEVKSPGINPKNYRTPALDFDSLFGSGPTVQAAPSVYQYGGLSIGVTTSGDQYDDLPRSVTGEPALREQRNDNNLALAQLHVLFVKFFQIVASQIRDPAEARIFARRHLQWVILHDYLKRTIDPVIYEHVMSTGDCVLLPETEAFLVPIEFATATFRIGHAMVRSNYHHWNDRGGVHLEKLIEFTHLDGHGRLSKIDGEYRLKDNWKVDWNRLSSTGRSRNDVSMAASIDEKIARKMHELPSELTQHVLSPNEKSGICGSLKPKTFSIAIQTLLRGNRMHIPSGQSVYQIVQERLKSAGAPALQPRIRPSAIANVRSPQVREFLLSENGKIFQESTPLWFYCLREADQIASGQRTGPLASRINMETIYKAILSDCDGVLQNKFKPAKEYYNLEGVFDFPTIVDIVKRYWKPNIHMEGE